MSSLNYMVGVFYTITVLHVPKQFKKNLKNRSLIGIRTNRSVGDCLSLCLNCEDLGSFMVTVSCFHHCRVPYNYLIIILLEEHASNILDLFCVSVSPQSIQTSGILGATPQK